MGLVHAEPERRRVEPLVKWRTDGPLAKMPELKRAWSCKDGNPVVHPDSLRARIW